MLSWIVFWMKIEYNYIKYLGDTIYTKDVYRHGWYTKVSNTFLTKGKIYKLKEPRTSFLAPTFLDLIILDDIGEYGFSHNNENYDGRYTLYSGDVQFITNRDYNLMNLIQ